VVVAVGNVDISGFVDSDSGGGVELAIGAPKDLAAISKLIG
jgi:hypothetical protein